MTNQRAAAAFIAALLSMTSALTAEQNPPTPVATAHPQSVKITGCVERAPDTAASRASAADAKFMLTMAQVEPIPAVTTAAQPVARSGPVVAAAAGEVPTAFRLDGDDAMIEPHVGHKVEVSGEIVEAIAPAISTPTPSITGQPVPAAGTPPASEVVAARPDTDAVRPTTAPRLKVIEIRMLTMVCP
jgi:hypothetical protein